MVEPQAGQVMKIEIILAIHIDAAGQKWNRIGRDGAPCNNVDNLTDGLVACSDFVDLAADSSPDGKPAGLMWSWRHAPVTTRAI